MKTFIQLLNPFAPHLAEELWERMGEKSILTFEKWPTHDPQYIKEDLITVAVQVMGKTRGTIEIPPGTEQEQALSLALQLTTVTNQIQDKPIRKVIFIKDKILNLVV